MVEKILAKRVNPVEYKVRWGDGAESWVPAVNLKQSQQLVTQFNRVARDRAASGAKPTRVAKPDKK